MSSQEKYTEFKNSVVTIINTMFEEALLVGGSENVYSSFNPDTNENLEIDFVAIPRETESKILDPTRGISTTTKDDNTSIGLLVPEYADAEFQQFNNVQHAMITGIVGGIEEWAYGNKANYLIGLQANRDGQLPKIMFITERVSFIIQIL